MITKTFSSTNDGIEGAIVQIEAISLNSLPQIHMTGLPGEVVKESRERVRACLVNLGFDVPSAKVLVHLSPASIKKTGSHYDLAIALSVLSAESKLKDVKLEKCGFLGEVSLDGLIKPVRGALPLIEVLARDPNLKTVVIPVGNEGEGALINNEKIVVSDSISEVIAFLKGQKELRKCRDNKENSSQEEINIIDEIIGQSHAKRALQIALAGRHHMLMVGPPGVGKSMLSIASVGLLPKLFSTEFIDVLKIYGVSSVEVKEILETKKRPFRNPHHTISANALLGGGGGTVYPGEVSLAHHGVLFMDEFPEFRRDAIEGLREPLQTGVVNLNRVGRSMAFPAKFTLIAAMNPCPCGMFSALGNRCRCSPEKLGQYRKKLSSPVLDRIGIMVNLSASGEKLNGTPELRFADLKSSIQSALEIQRERYRCEPYFNANGEIDNFQSNQQLNLNIESQEWLNRKKSEEGISYRRLNNVVKIARTIADLERSNKILYTHVVEAWGLRCFDFYQHG